MKAPARWLSLTALLALLVSTPFFLSEPTAARGEAGRGVDFRGPAIPGSAAKSDSAEDRAVKARERADRSAVVKAREELRSDPRVGKIWENDSYESNLAGDFRAGFDSKALRELLDQAEPDDRMLVSQILLAAAERNPACKDLLLRSDLRQKYPVFDLALSAYDFMVNGSDSALERILDAHRSAPVERGSWDSNPIWVLSYVDEWPRTEAALKSHLLMADGAGGDARYGFWLQRRYLFPLNQDFPKDYERFWKDLARAQGWKWGLD